MYVEMYWLACRHVMHRLVDRPDDRHGGVRPKKDRASRKSLRMTDGRYFVNLGGGAIYSI